MSPEQLKVAEFMIKFEQDVPDKPTIPTPEVQDLRLKLIREEADELEEAYAAGDLVKVADAIADLLYVVYGAACASGIAMSAIFEEVHRSNMSKIWPDGTVHKNEHGKVIKPETYSPADLEHHIAMQLMGRGLQPNRTAEALKRWIENAVTMEKPNKGPNAL